MKRTIFSLVLAFCLGLSAEATTPKEVLEPYKAYRTALKAENRKDAADYAYKAWKLAEDLMGDSKTTGDLAANFAELRPKYINDKQAWKLVMKAHKRAIDLSSLHEVEPDVVEIDRRTKYLSWLIPNVSTKIRGANDKSYSPERLKARIEELGMTGSTFHAESFALNAQLALIKKDWKEAERNATKSIEVFDSRTDGIPSFYEFSVPIYLARALEEGNKPVDAALTYQALMTKMETKGGHDNAISSAAYADWLRLRDEVAENNLQDSRALEVVNFTVPAGRKSELSPLVRKPPVMPQSFLRSSKSGFVKVKFNIDIEGRIINPVITSSTNERLHKATLESLKGWRYTPNLPEARSRDVETTIRFDLLSPSGRRMKYDKEVSRL